MPVTIHGKEYLTVAERVNQIHKDYKGMISITTEVLKFDDEKAMVKATAIIYEDSDSGDLGRIFTGHAFERSDASRINETSYLEVCETSAIGRALAAASYGGSEFASADEVANAITEQTNGDSKPKTYNNSPPPSSPKKAGGTASPKSHGFMVKLMSENNWEGIDSIEAIQAKIDEGVDLTQSEVSNTIDKLKSIKPSKKTEAKVDNDDDELPF